MIAAMPVKSLTPQELWGVLEEHNLLSSSILANPGVVAQLAQTCNFLVLCDEDKALGFVLEMANREPEVLDIILIPHDRGLGKRRAEIAELGKELRGFWFEDRGCRRVQAMVPASRVNVQRFLRALGFIEETRRGVGLRDAVCFGKKPEAMLIYGLLPSDPIRDWDEKTANSAHNETGVQVG